MSEWGATLVSLRTPPGMAHDAPREILLGWARPEQWEANGTYFGSTVGRFANRVAGGRLEVDGRAVELEVNAPPHHLHGGPRGLSHQLWRGTASRGAGSVSVVLHCRSPHGDQGWPGNLDVQVRYTLDDDNRLTMAYEASTDAPTHVNLTGHAYLNLAGIEPAGDTGGAGPEPVHDHRLQLHAAAFTPTDASGIPTGEIRTVRGTPLDFTSLRPLGPGLTSPSPLVAARGGFDHNFVLDGFSPAPDGRAGDGRPSDPFPCARVEHPATGRVLQVATTCPGVQLYTANGLDETDVRGGRCGPHTALCLETQFFPDTPNQPDFPSTRLDPGQVWRHVTTWTLGSSSHPETP